MKYYYILLAFLTYKCMAEKVHVFDYYDSKGNQYEYVSTPQKILNLKKISVENIEEVIKPHEAIIAVESTVEYKNKKYNKKNLDSITLSFDGVPKINDVSQLIYVVTYKDSKGFYDNFYVLSNGVVLEKIKIKPTKDSLNRPDIVR